MLTAGEHDARQLALLLAGAGVEFDIVTFAYPAPTRRAMSATTYAMRRVVAFVKSRRVLRALWQRRLPRFPRRPHYIGYCNSERMLRELRRLQPDYIVMMGGCILSAEAIGTARMGVLNAHPGVLPWVRGVNVMEHSLLRDVALGATGHFIDVGIDTGPILLRYLLPVDDESSRPPLHAKLTALCAGLMCEMVTRLARGEQLTGELQQEKHPYCRRLSPEESEHAERLVRQGKARELYLKWRREQSAIPDGAETLRRVSVASF
jgi:folate-dependent phosphoribosylglycinamide formyltransferase PurN